MTKCLERRKTFEMRRLGKSTKNKKLVPIYRLHFQTTALNGLFSFFFVVHRDLRRVSQLFIPVGLTCNSITLRKVVNSNAFPRLWIDVYSSCLSHVSVEWQTAREVFENMRREKKKKFIANDHRTSRLCLFFFLRQASRVKVVGICVDIELRPMKNIARI